MNNSTRNFMTCMARPGCAKVRGHRTEEPPSWVSYERGIVYNTKVLRNEIDEASLALPPGCGVILPDSGFYLNKGGFGNG